MKEIDARGLACPKPVVLTKKAMTENDEILTIVDNKTASENVAKLARKLKAEVSVCLLYTSPSPRDRQKSRMPSSA